MEKKYFNYKKCVIIFVLFGIHASISAMVYDNRYLPLLQKLLVKKPCSAGQIMLQPFAWTGDNAYYEDFDEEARGASVVDGDIPLFNVNGLYNQMVIQQGLLYTGALQNSLLPSQFIGAYPTLTWAMEGILRGQGLGVTFYQPLTSHISWGFNFFFASLNSALNLKPDRRIFGGFTPGDFLTIESVNNDMQDILGLSARDYSTIGISDIEVYLRFGVVEDYRYKMRHFDIGVNIGALIPAAQKVNYFNPAAIPLGGNGHWGLFVSCDGQFELKENIGVGLLLRLNKRFALRDNRRMVQFTEPSDYGVLYGASKVDPGVTVIFSPYGQLLRLRSGFGLQAQYTLIYHQNDTWKDLRCNGQPPANIDLMERRSEWASEYVNVAALYEFSKDSKDRIFKPIITFAVDIPVHFFIAKRVVKTFGISITVESTLW